MTKLVYDVTIGTKVFTTSSYQKAKEIMTEFPRATMVTRYERMTEAEFEAIQKKR